MEALPQLHHAEGHDLLWDERGFRTGIDLWQLDEVRAALARFHALKDRLPKDQIDVGQYHIVEDLAAVMPTRIARSQRRAEKESLKARPMRRSDILFQDDRWMVARLKGFAAARFWGFGTRWCTTMAEHTFWSYLTGGEMLAF